MAGVLAAGALALMWALPAQAQATRTWVSGTGDDVNPCSRTAPCKTFPGAISKTAAGGSINVLDPGGFGAVTIVKAMTISSEGFEAGILVAGTNGVTVNAGANDTIVLRGIDFDGGPTGSNSLAGVRFLAGKALMVQKCTIKNFTGGSPNGFGINFTPSSNATIYVSDTVISNNGAGSAGGGIAVAPTGGATAQGVFYNVQLLNNTNGVKVDTTNGGGVSTAVMTNSVVAGGIVGVAAVASGTQAIMQIEHTVVQNNSQFGVFAFGSGAQTVFGTSIITKNATGISASGGATISWQDNEIAGNTTNGTPTVMVTKS
jgi:hypothetical protein